MLLHNNHAHLRQPSGDQALQGHRVDGLYTGCQESKPRLAPRRCTSTFAATAQKGRKDSLTF